MQKNILKIILTKCEKMVYKHSDFLLLTLTNTIMAKVRELTSNKLACVVTYGALKRTVAENEILGVHGMHEIPDVGEFNHWNMKKVVPCVVENGKYIDIRTGELVSVQGNSQVWPLLTGTVLCYPDGKQLLLSRRFNKEGSIMVLDITGTEHPVSTNSLTVKN